MPARLLFAVTAAVALGGCAPTESTEPVEPPTPREVEKAPRPQAVATPTQIQNLRALPYTDGTFDPDSDQKGVILHDEERSFDGLNFFSSVGRPAAFLLDMEGKLVHKWQGDRKGTWKHVDLLPTGEVLVLIHNRGLFKIDLESKILWRFRGKVHHDHWRTPEGLIYVLDHRGEHVPELHPRHKVIVDLITVLSPEGEKIEEISILELIRSSPFHYLLPSLSHRNWSRKGEEDEAVELDILHSNHIEIFDGTFEEHSPIFRKGNALVSLRNIDTIAVVDLESREILWVWGPSNLTRQHHPTVTDNGHFLIFNNGVNKSEVLELDPLTLRVTWRYEAGAEFFSRRRGSNQRLPNGNTLITESDTGYVFEVTPDGEKVWEFANPNVNKKRERYAIWRMARFHPDELPFLKRLPR